MSVVEEGSAWEQIMPENRSEVAVVVDERGLEPPLEEALAKNDVQAVHTRNCREAIHLIRLLGVRCLVILGRVHSLRSRLELTVRLKDDHPDCEARHPVIVTDRQSSDVPEEAPCIVAKTQVKRPRAMAAFFQRLLLRLRWRSLAA